MSSKVLDYERPGKKARTLSPVTEPGQWDTPFEARSDLIPARVQPVLRPETPAYTGPVNYPAIAEWLKSCEDDLERGRDKHGYSVLSSMFAANGCTRIDDITRLSSEAIKSLAEDAGLVITIGLVNRVSQYAQDDVARVKAGGNLRTTL